MKNARSLLGFIPLIAVILAWGWIGCTDTEQTSVIVPIDTTSDTGAWGGGGPGKDSTNPDGGGAIDSVLVNGLRLSGSDLSTLQGLGMEPDSGSYWYDPASGAWGPMGGATRGYTLDSLAVFAPLPTMNVSGGTTGIWINGRQLTSREVSDAAPCYSFDSIRYEMDSQGELWVEGSVSEQGIINIGEACALIENAVTGFLEVGTPEPRTAFQKGAS